MKKLFLAIVLIASVSVFAQEKRELRQKMTSEQQTELFVKKLQLDLDLNEKQVVDVKKVVLAQIEKRKIKSTERKAMKQEGVKLSTDEEFDRKNKALEEQIAYKAEMKKILTTEQFSKWELIQEERKSKLNNKPRFSKKVEDLEEKQK